MKNSTYSLLIFLLQATLLSSCSVSPGIPGLHTAATRYAKTQKEGVDYKLIRIDAQIINDQQPFDYIAYVKKKNKQLSKLTKTNSERLNTLNSTYQRDQTYYSNQTRFQDIRPHNSTFQGITAQDNKANYRYHIGKNDVLNIIVWDHPELTVPTEDSSSNGHIVDESGRFYFPYAGKVNAIGKTTGEIQNALRNKLAKVITNPQISVQVKGFRSQKIYTSGAVLKPTTLHLSDVPITVRDAISHSGGVTPRLYAGYAILARGNKNISIDINRMLKYNDNRQNFLLKNGDRLHIIEKNQATRWRVELNHAVQKEQELNPIRLKYELRKEQAITELKKRLAKEHRAKLAKVFVMGEVHNPGAVKYQIEDGMSLVEAINDAGSFKEETVNPKGVFVIRQENTNDKIPTVYQLYLASVHSILLAEQFKIRPRDIVYVTSTPTIRWNRVLSQLIPSLTLVNTISNLSR